MIIHIPMKTPDALADIIAQAVQEHIASLEAEHVVFDKDAIRCELTSQAEEVCNKWFEYGETIHLTVDTYELTCEVDMV